MQGLAMDQNNQPCVEKNETHSMKQQWNVMAIVNGKVVLTTMLHFIYEIMK